MADVVTPTNTIHIPQELSTGLPKIARLKEMDPEFKAWHESLNQSELKAFQNLNVSNWRTKGLSFENLYKYMSSVGIVDVSGQVKDQNQAIFIKYIESILDEVGANKFEGGNLTRLMTAVRLITNTNLYFNEVEELERILENMV